MKFYKSLFILLICGFSVVRAQPTDHNVLLYSDALDDNASTALGTMVNYGGKFIPGKGWQATTRSSKLFITLPEGLPSEGTFVIHVTNFDPINQNNDQDLKQHIVNLFSRKPADKSIYDTDASWFNIRTQTHDKYSAGEGKIGFKFLAHPRSVDSRDEDYFMKDMEWDPKEVYQFKVTWTTERIYIFVNNTRCGRSFKFEGQIEPLRYIYIGRDNLIYGYTGQAGPIWSDLRIYAPGEDVISPTNFTDITVTSNTGGYSASGYGSGISLADVNNDGHVDIFSGNSRSGIGYPDLLYINKGDNTFAEQAELRGVKDVGSTRAIVTADFDNDGDLDAFYGNSPLSYRGSGGGNHFYQNDGNGYFQEVSNQIGISAASWVSAGAIAADLNSDGFLDLYIANSGPPNEMYINQGDGTFSPVNYGANGQEENDVIFVQYGVTAGDIDNDDDIDLYVCRRALYSYEAPNWLFINEGNGSFSEKGVERGVGINGFWPGPSFADVDNDGDLDLFVVGIGDNIGAPPRLAMFYNNDDGTFTDKTYDPDYQIFCSGFSAAFGDVDNDGDPDMLLLHNNERQRYSKTTLYSNDGAGKFTPAANSGVEVAARDARSVGYGDVDNDGDIDFYITCSDGQNFLLRNDLDNTNHFIQVLCRGARGDLGGIGSRVAVYEPGYLGDNHHLLGYQQVISNFGYMCQSQPILHFGLGEYTSCDIRVVRTTGETLDFIGVSADQLFIAGETEALTLAKVSGDGQSGILGKTLMEAFVVKITDDQDVGKPGVRVTFSVVQGDGEIVEKQPVVTDANGRAQAFLRIGTGAGEVVVHAASSGVEGSPVMFTVHVEAPVVTLKKHAGDGQEGRVDQVLPDSIVVRAVDQYDDPVQDYKLCFMVEPGSGQVNGSDSISIETNTRGLAAVAWRLGTRAGAQEVQAITADSAMVFTAKALPDVAARMVAMPSSEVEVLPAVEFNDPFSVKITDKYENPVPGHEVTFQITKGGGHLRGVTERTVAGDSSGVASAYWTPGPYLGPTNELQAVSQDGQRHLEGSPHRWLFEGPPLDLDKSSVEATTPVLADGISTSAITVTLKDSSGGPAKSGFTVKIKVTGTQYTLVPVDTLTDENGQVMATMSSTFPETKVIKAMVAGLNQTVADSAVVDFLKPPVVADTLILVSGDGQTGVVGNPLAEPFVVRVLDRMGQPIVDYSVIFRVLSDSGHFAPADSVVVKSDGQGQARAILTLGRKSAADNHLVQAMCDRFTVYFKASAAADAPVALFKVSGDSQVVLANEEAAQPFVVRSEDRYGNRTAGADVEFGAFSAGQVLTPQPAKTDQSGLARCKIIAPAQSGIFTFEARLAVGAKVNFTIFVVSLVVNNPPTIETVRDTLINEDQLLHLNVRISDPDGDTVTVKTYGMVEGMQFVGDSLLAWQPGFEQAGIYQLTFTARDSKGDSTSSVVRIHVQNVNRPPQIISFVPDHLNVTGQYGVTIDFAVTGAVDPDGDMIKYQWLFGNAKVDTSTFLKFTPVEVADRTYQITVLVYDHSDTAKIMWQIEVKTGVYSNTGGGPSRFVLYQNHPNPFNPSTIISFETPGRGRVDLRIYNLSGQMVSEVYSGELEAGYHAFQWQALDRNGQSLPSGIYYYVLSSPAGVESRTLLFLK